MINFSITDNIQLKKHVIDDSNQHLIHMYNIVSYPSLILIKHSGEQIHYNSDKRDKKSFDKFLKDNNV